MEFSTKRGKGGWIGRFSTKNLILRSFLTFWGRNVPFWGLGKGSNAILGSTYVVEQFSFSLSLNSDIWVDSILGSFFTFWALTGYFGGWCRVQKLFWGLLI